MNRLLAAKLLTLCLALYFLSPYDSFNQSYKFKKYGIQQGICHPFVYTINQDKNGFIWIGTGEGLCRFDGFDFSTETVSDIVERDVANISFKDTKGNLWFGFHNGAIIIYDGKKFTPAKTIEPIKGTITGFAEDTEGNILVSVMTGGILVIKDFQETKRISSELNNNLLTFICLKKNLLLSGSQEGLSIYSYQPGGSDLKLLTDIKELEYIKIQNIKPSISDDGYWIGTEDEGLYFLQTDDNGSYSLRKKGEEFNLGTLNVQSIYQDGEKNLWVSTLRSGVYKFLYNESENSFSDVINYTKENGLTGNSIKEVFEDREGNIWIATYGDGLAIFLSDALTFYGYQVNGFDNNITAVCAQDSIVWLGGMGNLLKTNITKENKPLKFNTAHGLPNDLITALFYDKKGTLWIGTEKNGIYRMNVTTGKISKFVYPANSLGLSVKSIIGEGNSVYAATKEGIYYFNPDNDEKVHYSTNNGLPHNVIEHVFLDSENNLLFATQANGIYAIDAFGEIQERFITGDFELDFNSIAQDKNGNIWASTYGFGVYFFGKDTFINITAEDGLKSDFCYSIIASGDGNVWVGHRLGITKININSFSKYIYDVEKGITGDCNYNSVCRDRNGKLFFGTTEGLICYDPSKDKSASIPPNTNILRVLINDQPVDFKNDILLPYSKYKIRIEFAGLYYRDPERVNYRYKLEGFDPEWSDVSNLNYVVYPRITDGKYTFYLKSFIESETDINTPVIIKLRIKLPFYKTWWFILLSLLLLVVIVLLIIKFRERKQKQLQEYLEKSLAERTREVVEQKEEIEIKNRDITDSINYAQRIQASILPPIKRLQQNFAGAFVFYQPRDIVSGDFYWYDKISDSKFIIVCADSTGHGVPGAFMSMIGTTLIKDICFREATGSPSEILRSLDQELRNTLNQNLEAEKANDGMDIIVCEIDLKSYYIRYASAMRPMIVYKNGEEIYVKGSRSSVGGHYDKSEKNFQDEGIQLSPGDLIYMFSDGYPDQFGGPMGKKFKMVRLKSLLEDINKKPMEEQYNHVKNTFNLWKDAFPQVDDVLFMGIKL
ncbi:MAG: SpoIIE family protein phosphatase [Bacteroidales bacterium]|nr:SpoIIE family protein phosphatase [Bacteroidales bacterium]